MMGLIERVESLECKEKEREEKKQKKFRIPRMGKVSLSKARKGYVTIMKINENGHVDFKKEPIDNQTIMVDGVPRLAANKYVMFFKKNPLIILPSWSVEPFCPKQDYERSLADGSNTAGYRLLLDRMKNEGIKTGKKAINWGMSIGGLIVLVIIGYALITGGA